jgi:uncharacterized membrane protein
VLCVSGYVCLHRNRALQQNETRSGADDSRDVSPAVAAVYFTGLLEFMGAVGLLLPRFRSVAGICLMVLLIAIFPANVSAAMKGTTLAGKPATALWLRAPTQALFIGVLWWSTRP